MVECIINLKLYWERRMLKWYNTNKRDVFDKTFILIRIDKEIDKGDGSNHGLVRWVECKKDYSSKKECFHAGNF